MREILIIIFITCLGTGIFLSVTTVMDNNYLKWENEQLRLEIEKRKIMTKDMKRMALTAECSVIKVDTDFTSREILWSLSDILIENGCEVKIH